jgi:UPF0755 protein
MTMDNENKTIPGKQKAVIITLLLLMLIGIFFGMRFYKTYFSGNILKDNSYIFVRTGGSVESLYKELESGGYLKDIESFKRAADKMDLATTLKPGRYKLTGGMNNRTLINKIKAGNQDAVNLKFQNLRRKEDFAGYLAKQLEPDSASFIKLLDSTELVESLGFNKENIYTMFIPNTYEMYWNTPAMEFIKKMNAEYTKFWTEERKKKAEALNLTPIQVSILASIVDGEAIFDKEMPTIAGLYLNRLSKGIKLQADPTVIFANNDFTVKRVTYDLLQIESKYNTYKYAGLPPGPIMMPSIKAIDAVLNKEDNNYLYMCAKEDFSGYHNFAETKAQHEINADKYRQALNDRKIFR